MGLNKCGRVAHACAGVQYVYNLYSDPQIWVGFTSAIVAVAQET
jgi:hypothetical protein